MAPAPEGTLLGLADSGAHVSQLCDACFATDLLGNWVREKEVLPLERAIYKLTGEPAHVFGLADRGTVEVGKAADVCVFDPETVDPGPLRRLYDFPANGERLTADAPTGVTHVLVNGTPDPRRRHARAVRRASGGHPSRRPRHVSLTSIAGRRPGHDVRSGFSAARDRSRMQPRHTPAP